MTMSGFDEFFAMLGRVGGLEAALEPLGDELATQMASAMQDEVGTYQQGWPDLAASTQAERERLGYTSDDPLLRSGEMQKAIRAYQDETGAWCAGIPADDPTAEYATAQEFGTIDSGGFVPARPFVGPIAEDYGQKAVDGVAVTIEQAL